MSARIGKGFRIKDGKIVKTEPRVSVSERLRQKHSKRIRVVRRGKTA